MAGVAVSRPAVLIWAGAGGAGGSRPFPPLIPQHQGNPRRRLALHALGGRGNWSGSCALRGGAERAT